MADPDPVPAPLGPPILARPSPTDPAALVGWLAGLGAVTLWAGYAVATRGMLTQASLPIWDVLAIRVLAVCLLTLPVLLREWRVMLGLPPLVLSVVVLGSGAPFSLGNAGGLAWAPAAHSGALLAPLGAVFTALLAWVVLDERVGRRTGFGLGLISLGAALVVVGTLVGPLDPTVLIGHAHFAAAALMWSIYTVTLRHSPRIGVFGAVAIAAWGSLLVYLLPYLAIRGPRFLAAPPGEIVLHALIQGVIGAWLSILLFNLAVKRLGASRAAALGAVVPAETALLGWLFLGELPTAPELLGLAALSLGVWLSAGGRLPERLLSKTRRTSP